MQHRNMHSHDGSDTYTRHILLWCCQLPVEQVWSFDIRHTSQKTIQSTATLGLALQIMFMYLGTCLNRTTDLYSLSELTKSEWLPPQLSAVFLSLSSSFASRDNWLGNVVRQTPILNQFMTLSAMLIEGLAPIFCFLLPFSQQHYPAVLLFSLHFGLLILMNLPNWQFVGMLTTVVWIPTQVWDRLERTTQLPPLRILHLEKKNDHVARQQHSQRRPYWTFFFLIYMTYNWLGERGVVAKHDGGDIGEFLRFSQHWVMFGKPPKTSVHTILIGTSIGDGHTVDVWEWIKTRKTTKVMNVDERRSQLWTNMTHIYPSPRWERALDGWGHTHDYTRARYLLQRLCQEGPWEQLTLIWQDLQVGTTARFEKRGPDIVVSIPC